MSFNVYVWGPHGGWAMLSGLVHKCLYVFNFYWFCTLSLNKDFIIISSIISHTILMDHVTGSLSYGPNIFCINTRTDSTCTTAVWTHGPHCMAAPGNLLKVIYQPLYSMNNDVLIWGDWLACDPLRGSHDSQSPHIRKHLCTILWQLWFICHTFIHTI